MTHPDSTRRPDPRLGSFVDGRYQILERIGSGGMGDVYLAEHRQLARKFAIKLLKSQHTPSDELLARFQREAMAAASVGNPHIVDVTDMGRLDDGTWFVVLEYLEGEELARRVGRLGPLPVARAVHIASQLCDALSAVHARHIVHRDLKPDNVMLIDRHGDPDFVKVLDFGICKLLDAQADARGPQTSLTHTNASLGTPHYMAPEQFRGSATVDARADIHALGAVLYFMLTGGPPYLANNLPMLCMRVCTEPPPSARARRSDVPHALDELIRRACAKLPQQRFQGCEELRNALRAIPLLDHEGAQPVGTAPGWESGVAPARSLQSRAEPTSVRLPADASTESGPYGWGPEMGDPGESSEEPVASSHDSARLGVMSDAMAEGQVAPSAPRLHTANETLPLRNLNRIGLWSLAVLALLAGAVWLATRTGAPREATPAQADPPAKAKTSAPPQIVGARDQAPIEPTPPERESTPVRDTESAPALPKRPRASEGPRRFRTTHAGARDRRPDRDTTHGSEGPTDPQPDPSTAPTPAPAAPASEDRPVSEPSGTNDPYRYPQRELRDVF